jgi:hypothetical protein
MGLKCPTWEAPMRTKLFKITLAAVCAAITFTFFACGTDSPTGGDNQPANSVIITLTSWEATKKMNPKVTFTVEGYKNSSVLSTKTSNVLLEIKGYTDWQGSKESSPLSFAQQADSIIISAKVMDVGMIYDDNISPGYKVVFHPPFNVGKSGSQTLNYGTGKSKVSFNYEFRQ